MASRLNPYLTFDGNAREAMEFYQSVLGGDLAIATFGEYAGQDGGQDAGEGAGQDGGQSSPPPDGVMHALLETDSGFTLMASDAAPGMDHRPGNTMAVSLSGDDADELRGYWEKLSADGSVIIPLERQMWGDEFGMCNDRFGTAWMVNIGSPQP